MRSSTSASGADSSGSGHGCSTARRSAEGGFPRRDPAAWADADARFERGDDGPGSWTIVRPAVDGRLAGRDRRVDLRDPPGAVRRGRLLPRAGPELALDRRPPRRAPGRRRGTTSRGPPPVRPHRRLDAGRGPRRRPRRPRRRRPAGDRLGPPERRAQRTLRRADPLDRRRRRSRSSGARPAATGATTGSSSTHRASVTGPAGRPWRLADDLPELLEACAAIVASGPAFVVLSAHTPGLRAGAARRRARRRARPGPAGTSRGRRAGHRGGERSSARARGGRPVEPMSRDRSADRQRRQPAGPLGGRAARPRERGIAPAGSSSTGPASCSGRSTPGSWSRRSSCASHGAARRRASSSSVGSTPPIRASSR